jgi:hypothetical protein
MSKFSDEFGCSKRAMAKELRSAANVIDRYGWRQKTLGNKRSGFCAFGALLEFSDIPCVVETFMFRRVNALGQGLVTWNDHPSRTKEQVTGLFRETASRLEHGELS